MLGTRIADWLSPAAEASQGDDGYRIAIELPGVAESDVHVTVDEGVLTVKGEKRSSREEKGDDWFFSERQYGTFSRSFRLPGDADPDGVAAEMKDGLLTVVVRRKSPDPARSARRIPVARA
jgi:HSP20 family protein